MLLVLVLIPGVGKVVYGARRWLSLGVLNLQPSELMKLFVVLYAADYTVRKQDYMQQLLARASCRWARRWRRSACCCCSSPTSARSS